MWSSLSGEFWLFSQAASTRSQKCCEPGSSPQLLTDPVIGLETRPLSLLEAVAGRRPISRSAGRRRSLLGRGAFVADSWA